MSRVHTGISPARQSSKACEKPSKNGETHVGVVIKQADDYVEVSSWFQILLYLHVQCVTNFTFYITSNVLFER